MSEPRFIVMKYAESYDTSGLPTILESEFHRRIDLAFRAAFCTLTETFDYDKAVEILVKGKE